MKNYMDALKRRKDETGDSGFSLIELIVVVVILGVLAAIAVPVFMGLQKQSEQGALDTATANAASQVASDIASAPAATPATLASVNTNVDKLQKDEIALTVTATGTFGVDTFCVTGTKGDLTEAKSGPGC
jgi:prepilin-type N-terminal cleavage/methylation domain-containing protein